MAAVTAGVVGAGAAAYGAHENARAAEAGTTTTSEPWSAQVPYLEQIFGEAQNLYTSGGPEFYPDATYVPLSQQTQTGLSQIESQAMAGDPLNASIQNYAQGVFSGSDPTTQAYQNFLGASGTDTLAATAAGDFLNANPYLDQMYSSAAQGVTEQFNEDIMPSLNATFSLAGRTGSPAHQSVATDAAGELADSLGRLSTDIYGSSYQTERQNQLSAANQLNQQALSAGQGMNALQSNTATMLPMLTDQNYDAANRLLGVGGIYEGQSAAELQDSMDRWNFEQNADANALAQYQGFIQGNYGGTSNTSTASAANSYLSALGGGLAGYNMFAGTPTGTQPDSTQAFMYDYSGYT